ncbi:uncharacterized protein N7482_004035 [Penicillium canariense]|uniref:Uncharacterized protein n=1 Tax=Penicillium canariense TaxID=189055 RepID=A0A9W9I5U2_9EURO|nr:uncharacterized protein N7482_004035 [Penicillium canariense]KAJ5168441.1 hypothetical protein N7482_004035 [Penicillium canariense]
MAKAHEAMIIARTTTKSAMQYATDKTGVQMKANIPKDHCRQSCHVVKAETSWEKKSTAERKVLVYRRIRRQGHSKHRRRN